MLSLYFCLYGKFYQQEAYCDMLVKYREELTRPIEEAMEYIRRIESQISMLCQGPIHILNNPGKCHKTHKYIYMHIPTCNH